MPEINVPLLDKVLSHLIAHPDEWQQQSWARRSACGTAYCVAGHVAVMTGHDVDWGHDTFGSPALTTAGELIPVVAQRELGLTDVQRSLLFAGTNTLGDLFWLAERYTDGAITAPDGIEAPRVEATAHRLAWLAAHSGD